MRQLSDEWLDAGLCPLHGQCLPLCTFVSFVV